MEEYRMPACTPAQAGLRTRDLRDFFDRLDRNSLNLHSVLMARRGRCFLEQYWEPFTAETPHRMYSVTKSFVSAAVGCLLDEGKLNLDDPIVRYFPDKLPDAVPPELAMQTIRDMLRMCTCFSGGNWFRDHVTDRLDYYFHQAPVRPAGTLFDYDSTASYVLAMLAERLSGEGLMSYLRRKLLDRIGGFGSAEMLETPNGTPWADSGLLCTPRALLNYAQFVLQRGRWEGEQLLSAGYLDAAVSRQTDNNLEDRVHYNRYGYGYQFWIVRDGWLMNGMGGQFALCIPEKEFLFVCTGDDQLNSAEQHPVLFSAVYDCIINRMADDPLPEEDESLTLPPLRLPVMRGAADSPVRPAVEGRWYVCRENPMGITRFRLDFPAEGEGLLCYVNQQDEKKLPFGIGKNVFCKFPQYGYSDQRGNVHEITDFRYDCAASGGWVDPDKLQIRVQIIDRYLGQLVMTFGFREDCAGVCMMKCAEDFLDEYEGWISARQE